MDRPIGLMLGDDDIAVLWSNTFSMLFDGIDGYANCGNDASLRITDNLTVLTWIKTSVTPAFVLGIVSQHDSNAKRSWMLAVDSNQKLRAQLSDDGSNSAGHKKIYESVVNVCDGAWHLVGFTFASGTFKLYLDGADIVVTKTADDAIVGIYNSDVNILIGGFYLTGLPARFFQGNIDEVLICDTAVLSTAEILAIYNSGKPKNEESLTNLVSDWRMGDKATYSAGIWTFPDQNGSNDATSVNMAESDRKADVP